MNIGSVTNALSLTYAHTHAYIHTHAPIEAPVLGDIIAKQVQ